MDKEFILRSLQGALPDSKNLQEADLVFIEGANWKQVVEIHNNAKNADLILNLETLPYIASVNSTLDDKIYVYVLKEDEASSIMKQSSGSALYSGYHGNLLLQSGITKVIDNRVNKTAADFLKSHYTGMNYFVPAQPTLDQLSLTFNGDGDRVILTTESVLEDERPSVKGFIGEFKNKENIVHIRWYLPTGGFSKDKIMVRYANSDTYLDVGDYYKQIRESFNKVSFEDFTSHKGVDLKLFFSNYSAIPMQLSKQKDPVVNLGKRDYKESSIVTFKLTGPNQKKLMVVTDQGYKETISALKSKGIYDLQIGSQHPTYDQKTGKNAQVYDFFVRLSPENSQTLLQFGYDYKPNVIPDHFSIYNVAQSVTSEGKMEQKGQYLLADSKQYIRIEDDGFVEQVYLISKKDFPQFALNTITGKVVETTNFQVKGNPLEELKTVFGIKEKVSVLALPSAVAKNRTDYHDDYLNAYTTPINLMYKKDSFQEAASLKYFTVGARDNLGNYSSRNHSDVTLHDGTLK